MRFDPAEELLSHKLVNFEFNTEKCLHLVFNCGSNMIVSLFSHKVVNFESHTKICLHLVSNHGSNVR